MENLNNKEEVPQNQNNSGQNQEDHINDQENFNTDSKNEPEEVLGKELKESKEEKKDVVNKVVNVENIETNNEEALKRKNLDVKENNDESSTQNENLEVKSEESASKENIAIEEIVDKTQETPRIEKLDNSLNNTKIADEQKVEKIDNNLAKADAKSEPNLDGKDDVTVVNEDSERNDDSLNKKEDQTENIERSEEVVKETVEIIETEPKVISESKDKIEKAKTDSEEVVQDSIPEPKKEEKHRVSVNDFIIRKEQIDTPDKNEDKNQKLDDAVKSESTLDEKSVIESKIDDKDSELPKDLESTKELSSESIEKEIPLHLREDYVPKKMIKRSEQKIAAPEVDENSESDKKVVNAKKKQIKQDKNKKPIEDKKLEVEDKREENHSPEETVREPKKAAKQTPVQSTKPTKVNKKASNAKNAQSKIVKKSIEEEKINPRVLKAEIELENKKLNQRLKKDNSKGKRQPRERKVQPRKKLSFKKLSVVIPLLNEYESLTPLYKRIKQEVKLLKLDHEIIFIDDGSSDNSLTIIKKIASRDQRVKYSSFRKNYGKSAALNEAFKRVKGDVVITMDADLQDDPAEIPNLLYKLDEGYDLVSGWKKKRFDPFIKRHSSKFFNWTTKILSGIKIHDFNCGLKAYRAEVVKNIYVHGELHRYIPVLANWKGFTVAEIPVKHHARRYGKTKYGISRFFKGFVDLVTVIFSTRYIKRPMHLFGFLGTVSFAFGFAINLYLSYEWWFNNQPLKNRPLLFFGMLLIIVGVQFFSTGLLGEIIVHNAKNEEEYSLKNKK